MSVVHRLYLKHNLEFKAYQLERGLEYRSVDIVVPTEAILLVKNFVHSYPRGGCGTSQSLTSFDHVYSLI